MTIASVPDASVERPDSHDAGAERGHVIHTCQNCGATLQGAYCHQCGQHEHVSRSVVHVIEEVLHGITHFDGRAMRSLPMLAFRPGTLTRNYVMGQRAKYVPPFAMFLFSVFAMFLSFAFIGAPGAVNTGVPITRAEAITDARERIVAAEAELPTLRAALTEREAAEAALPKGAPVADRVEAEGETRSSRLELESTQRELTQAQEALARAQALPVDAPNAIGVEVNGAGVSGDNAQTIMEKIAEELGNDDIKINTPWPDLNKKIRAKLENPELFLYKLQNTAYKFSFLLIPLSLPFLWLMFFWKKNVTVYDHAVFALYSLSFMSLLFIVGELLGKVPFIASSLGWAVLIPPIHLFFQFKGAYQLKWFSALWRTVLFCMLFSWVAIGLFMLSVIGLGAV